MKHLLLALLVAGCASAPSAAAFRAGAFAIDITPEKFPISVNGGMADRAAKGNHDPLHARCLVLDDGKIRIAIVVVDSCMVPREIFDEAKALAEKLTAIPPDRMLMSATHTHTAPTLGGVFQSDPDADYVKLLPRRIAEGVKKACDNLAPAQIGWATGSEPGQVFNRRWRLKPDTIHTDPFGLARDRVKMNPGYNNPDVEKPAGPIDPEIPIVALRSPDGRPIAVLANYSLHYVGGVEALSADYFGAFARRFTELSGAPTAILSNGTSGDINNVNFALKEAPKRKPGEQIEGVADAVARAAFEAWKRVEWRDHVPLAMREAEIELGVRRPSDADVARAREILAAAKGPVLKGLPEVYARETVLLADFPPTVKLKLQALRIGGLGIAAIPCEVFVEIGLDIKKLSPFKTSFTIELANGYNGYLPTPEHHALGGYETWRARSSYLEAEASTKITAKILDLLGQAAK